ncbi:MAG: hypothetical protein HY673_21885 [Chloroflexi bacterium]|nr:hypothetical protein [Chloroflexota bacterium]
MEPQEFKRQQDELGKIISNGTAYFSAWRGLMVEDEDSAHALNDYRNFFLPARDALLKMTLMQFAKVFDRHPKTVSLSNLARAAKKNRETLLPHATDNDLRDIEQKVDAAGELLKRLKRYRDQRLAHHDAVLAGDMRLRYGEVRKLIEETKSIYNLLSHGHEQARTMFEWLARDAQEDSSGVVRVMREERHRTTRRTKKIYPATR